MKKLMFMTTALVAGFALADISSANVVGYNSLSDGGNRNPGIGSTFFPIGGGDTFKLSSITVSADDDFMIPNLEYLQKLNPNGSAVVARYTYASVDWLKDEYEEEWEEYTNLLGWWEKDKVGTVSANDVDVDIGTAFLGFLGGKNLNFVSAGEVPSEATAFNDGGNRNPFFLNYLPLTIKLGAVTVTCEDDFMIPNLEYLQVLNPNGSAVIARYTYAGLDWLKDEYEDEWAEHTDLLGWWQKDHVGEEGYSANDVDLTPGFSFLGFLGGKGLDFNFPAAY